MQILKKEDFSKFINSFIKDHDIFAPVDKDNVIAYQKISSPDEIAVDYLNSKIPPKSIFFPQKDVLFNYEEKDGDIVLEDAFEKGSPKIIFGVRPCDAKSFKLLDNFFAFGSFKDKNYLERRKETVVIGLGCNYPKLTCFCTSVEGNPFNKVDVDILFTDIGDKYLIEDVTEIGKKFISDIDEMLGNASQEDIDKAETIKKKATEEIKVFTNKEDIIKHLEDLYEDPMWEEVSKKCIRCGACTFLCPTCHCFDVIDENIDKHKGRRVRIWDTCQFPLFTFHGSGHNPRDKKNMRTRQRLYHKFSYYIKNYDLCGCVGCGRCIQSCPCNSDIRETLITACEGGCKL